jgi:hypothetical protein
MALTRAEHEVGVFPGEQEGAAGWLRERALAVLGVALLFAGGYYAIAFLGPTESAVSLRTPLDDAIPFWPTSVIAYAWVYPAAFLPAFVVRSTSLFRRVLVAYLMLIGLAFAAFLLFPVSASGLRPEIESLDLERFSEWGTSLLYRLDPPVNLFPSLHLGLATLSALACWRVHRRIGALALVALALVAVAVCTVKQHFVMDALAGLGLAIAVDVLVVGRAGDEPTGAALPVAVPSAYTGAVVALYASFYAVFRLTG